MLCLGRRAARAVRLWLLAAWLMLLAVPAQALGSDAVLELPAGTTAVEPYAFSGCTALTNAVLPDGLLSIGAYAFEGCTGLTVVHIPASVQQIGEHAFPMETRIDCEADSYAAAWAAENGYHRTPVYRALLIGQEYVGSGSRLPGCFLDVASMRAMLETMTRTPYTVTLCQDLTASGILEAIASAFGDATEDDVSVLYYSGHGCYSSTSTYLGALVGVDGKYVTLSQLKAALDGIAGSRVIILDSCYSGAAISEASTLALSGGESGMDMAAIDAAIIRAFAPVTRSTLTTEGYYVLTAARRDETSVSGVGSSGGETVYFGAFTCSLLHGSGYNEITGAPLASLPADTDADGRITLCEAYTYAYARALTYNSAQHAQCSPEGSSFPLWAQ